MSIPPPPDRPDPPTEPLPTAGAPVVRERVVEQVVEPGPDPMVLFARLDDRLRSLRAAVLLLGLVSVAALALGLYALLRADEADRSGRDDGSRERVSQLDERVDELREDLDRSTRGTAETGDVDEVQQRLQDKADAADLAALEKAVTELRDQRAAPAGPDQETADAINELSRRLDALEQRVEEQQQAP